MIRTRSRILNISSSVFKQYTCTTTFRNVHNLSKPPFDLKKELYRIQNLHTTENQFIQEITERKPQIEETIFCNQELEYYQFSWIYNFR